jgi:hypothetical protein
VTSDVGEAPDGNGDMELVTRGAPPRGLGITANGLDVTRGDISHRKDARTRSQLQIDTEPNARPLNFDVGSVRFKSVLGHTAYAHS